MLRACDSGQQPLRTTQNFRCRRNGTRGSMLHCHLCLEIHPFVTESGTHYGMVVKSRILAMSRVSELVSLYTVQLYTMYWIVINVQGHGWQSPSSAPPSTSAVHRNITDTLEDTARTPPSKNKVSPSSIVLIQPSSLLFDKPEFLVRYCQLHVSFNRGLLQQRFRSAPALPMSACLCDFRCQGRDETEGSGNGPATSTRKEQTTSWFV